MKKILDWNEYIEKSAEAVAEGIVMLKNDNHALPLDRTKEIAVFGRIQLHYYKSGTGSGGLVNVSRVIGVTDGLIERGAKINSELLDIYKKWDAENPFDIGDGWGGEPWSQVEMPLDDADAEKAARSCDTALVVIGRTAGEEMDSSYTKGAYLLSGGEEKMLETVRRYFKKVVVLLNVGGIIDMGFVDKYSPDSVLYIWQGGMVGGLGTADVLLGNTVPSGKLPDTIAYSVEDYPSHKYFGGKERNFYAEDIYVGYRYFETFAKDKVKYPFGFGLSYTDFDIRLSSADMSEEKAVFDVAVKNIGSSSGKETVQIYFSAPQGKLGKAARELCAFEKTDVLPAGGEQVLHFEINISDLAAYDDSGASGYKDCYVLERGQYDFYIGSDVRSAEKSASVIIGSTKCISKRTQAAAPVMPFERMKNLDGKLVYENVPLSEADEEKQVTDRMPAEIIQTGDRGIKLADVRSGKNTLDEFIAQLSDEDLSCIIRGEGMGSPKVTAGTASAFGGVSKHLGELGIPCGCCDDGPSGMRLDCGTKAFSLPNGTLIASTFNKKLITELFAFTGREMTANNVDCLLGPGMNIHRHPLNGRNFEYFSEDPYLTGTMAAAELKGLCSEGVTGTIKHFCGNNQETGRHVIDSIISQRALREIYLRGFEIAIKDGGAKTVMTTYGMLNGVWTAGNFGLDTIILRDEWGFDGMVMTDWWANINRRGKPADKTDFAAMARAQNDVYMVCSDGENHEDNTLEALADGRLTRAELQRNAKNICRFILSTHAMDRLCGTADTVEIINREGDSDGSDQADVVFHKLDGTLTLDLSGIDTSKVASYVFALDVVNCGYYNITATASSNSGELAQLPMTFFSMGSPSAVFTWNGTGGEPVSITKELAFFSRFTTIRLYFAQSGLDLINIKFERKDKDTSNLVM